MLFCLSATNAVAGEYLVKNASTAIEIAKLVCKDKFDVRGKWEAALNFDGSYWVATTHPPSNIPGKPISYVVIPVNGPRPTKCGRSTWGVTD